MTSPTHHATCVAVGDAAVLIQGAAGTGKSALALQLMAFGAHLVADDQTCLTSDAQGVIASAPPQLSGLIEARGIGVLNAQVLPCAQVMLVVDMNKTEASRMPPRREVNLLGHDLPLLHKVDGIHFASAILQFMRAGRSER